MSVQFGGGFQLRQPYYQESSRYIRRAKSGPIAGAVDLTVTPSFPGISAPSAPTATGSTTGGTLAAATYAYQITAYNANGETTASTSGSATTTGATSSVSLSWSAVSGAAGYRVYGRVSGSLGLLADVGATLAYVDTGAVTPGAASPTVNGTQVITGATAGLINAGDALYRTAAGGLASLYNPSNSTTFVGIAEGNYPERLGIDNVTTVGRPQYDTHTVPMAVRTSGEFKMKTNVGDSYAPGASVYVGLDPQTVTVTAAGTAIGKVCMDQNPVGGDYGSTITGAAGQDVMIEIVPVASV